MADAGVVRRAVAGGLLAALGACGGGESRAGDAGGARGGPPENHATAAAAGIRDPSAATDIVAPPCPATGLWSECTLVERLEQAGLVLTPDQKPATEEPLQRQGLGFAARNATMEAYFYPSQTDRERDQRRLSPGDYLREDQAPGPVHKPTIVVSNNLLVILDTQRERQRERITLAITAGPPQPPTP